MLGESHQQHQETLRARARERIEQGLLPHAKAARTWGGRGSGLACSLCDAPIADTEPEMELEFDGSVMVRFHLQCQSIWDAERRAPPADAWTPIAQALPDFNETVEARLSLGGARSVILAVTRLQGGDGRDIWLNATTQTPLPEGWRPFEWRAQIPPPQTEIPYEEVPAPTPRRA